MSDKSKSEIVYRYATIHDASAVREILKFYIDNSNASWRYNVMDLDIFESWIINHQRPERPFWVAELNHQVIGYSSLSDFRSADGYWPCAENSVYVRLEFCGSGVGSKLMKLIVDQGRKAGLQAIIAAIDAENISSIRFHEKFNFYECGRMKNIAWKNNSWRTLVLMQCDLQPQRDVDQV
jgi:L-amino acid N-acyltransferase YncA